MIQKGIITLVDDDIETFHVVLFSKLKTMSRQPHFVITYKTRFPVDLTRRVCKTLNKAARLMSRNNKKKGLATFTSRRMLKNVIDA